MIDIYDEVGYVKEVLEHGLSPQKWRRDAELLVSYYKIEGYKKSEIKDILSQKCQKLKTYERLRDYKTLNGVIDKAWKKQEPLREIREIKISPSELNWFLNLEEKEISAEKVLQLKQKNRYKNIKKKIFTFQRIKFLFTLYIWTKIQENYLDKPYMHYLNKYSKKFKEDADLKNSFNLSAERNLMYDLGLIDINHAIGIDAKFIRENKEFSEESREEEKDKMIILSGEDLYHCGYWLQKQKMGSFICVNCGKEIANYTKNRTKPRKYCKECFQKIYYKKS